MSQRLDASLPRDRKRIFTIWWVWGLVALIGLGVWFMYNQQPELQAVSTSPDIAQSAIQKGQQSDQVTNSDKTLDHSVFPAESLLKSSRQMVSSKSTPSQSGSAEVLADTDISESSESDRLNSRGTKEEVQAPLIVMTARESQPIRDQETGALERMHTPLSQLPHFPLSHSFILPPPDMSGLSSLQISSPIELSPSEWNTESGYFVDLAAGARVAPPYSYVGQAGMGWRAPISDKWSYRLTWGAGVEGMHQPAKIALQERRSSWRSQEDEAISGPNEDISNNLSESGEFGAAEIQLRNHYFAYFGLHTAYQFASNWSISLGMETAYRFYVSSGESYALNFTSNGSFSTDNSSRNIAEDFVLFNRWDLRPVAGLNYKLRSNMSLNLTYRHGTNPLLPHPIQDTPAGYARFLQVGLRMTL